MHAMLEAWQKALGQQQAALLAQSYPLVSIKASLWCAAPHLVDAQDDGRALVAARRSIVHQAHVVGGAAGVLEVPGLDGCRAVAARLRTGVAW